MIYKKQHLQALYELVDQSCYNDNQKIALTSYMYNIGQYAMNIGQYVKNCDIESIKYIMNVYGYSSNGVKMGGLVKRRSIEKNKFNQ